MPIAPPQPGMVISYAYLRCGEHEQGREEGAKDRPVVIVLAAKDNDGDTIVIVAPIKVCAAPSSARYAKVRERASELR